jgi:hypothetical protein
VRSRCFPERAAAATAADAGAASTGPQSGTVPLIRDHTADRVPTVCE